MRVTMKRSSTTAARRPNVIESFERRSCSQGVGGLNLRALPGCYRIGLHAHIFFLSAELLIQSKRIKQIKRAVNAGVLQARDDEGPENWGFIFCVPRQPFSGDWKSAAKFRVGGRGSRMGNELMRWAE
jgi:hypothetical protein